VTECFAVAGRTHL